jgi:hypothetical protein
MQQREKNTQELKLKHFSALLHTTQKNDQSCRQQCKTFFCIAGTNAEKRLPLWGQQVGRIATTLNSIAFFVVSLSLP